MSQTPDPVTLLPVISAEELNFRLNELAFAIDAAYGNEKMVAICVLKGAFVFFYELLKRLANPNIEVDFVRLASYGMNSTSSKHVIFSKDIEVDILGKHVLIVEDIVDSGCTMRFLLDQLQSRGPASLRVAALVDKKERRDANVPVDFAGFNLDKGFIVGYGMDYAEKYRLLPDIRELVFEK